VADENKIPGDSWRILGERARGGVPPCRRGNRHLFAGIYGQGTLIVLNRQTSFGTFGGGDCNISIPCCNICGTSGGNTTPGGNGAIGSPVPGSSTAPGGHTAPGGNREPSGAGDGGGQGTPTVLNRQTSFGSFGGAGKSVGWSTRRTDADATVVSPVPSGAAVATGAATSDPAAAKTPIPAASPTFLMVITTPSTTMMNDLQSVAAAAQNGLGAGCEPAKGPSEGGGIDCRKYTSAAGADQSYLAGVRKFAAAAASWGDHLLMDQDDPEKRIAELERQLRLRLRNPASAKAVVAQRVQES